MTPAGPGLAPSFPVPESLYPFRGRWLEGEDAPDLPDDGALHYLDEGEGLPVLFLHGNPTWSFLWRDVIRRLEGLRRVAPDYPGFGRSRAPEGYGFAPADHARWVAALVEALDLERFVLAAHDWGGPIGLSLAVERPERVAGLVLCNTFCAPPDLWLRSFSWIMGGPVGRWLCLRRNFFARRIVPLGIHRRERRTPEVLAAYRAPFPTPESRFGTWIFPRAIRSAAAWTGRIEERLPSLRGRPVELVWGTRDPALGHGRYLARWRERFPDARVDRVADASHYVPEDRPDRVTAAVRRVARKAA